VKEQSQIDAMRAAIRGDLERSRARRESGDTGPPEPPPIDIRARPEKLEPVRARKPEPEPVTPEPVAEVATVAEPDPPEQIEEAAAVDEPAPRRGLLGRLFRR
jgi:hypothetical protein